ncbi:MAG: sulfatase [Cyclobacteriaceae bacterium]
MDMKTTRILLFTLLLTLSCFVVLAQQESNSSRPNVLIILSDDQGWGDVGFNGCTDIPTPNLDALAAEGVVMTQGYASHPYCSPSRAGLLTGRYQQRFGHENNIPYQIATKDDGLPVEELLISEALQKVGYRTCAIGKWHLGDSSQYWPNNQGFDDWYGFIGGGLSYWGNTGKKGAVHGILHNGQIVPIEEISYLTDDFSREAVSYIDQYSKDDDPFFMYLAYNAPHSPLQSPNEYLKVMDHQEDGQRAVYGAMVYAMDKGIGQVIEKLKETGEYENTLIFFYSDNGAALNGASSHPFRGHKGMLFEGGIRVPFLVSWPAQLDNGNVYDQPISALDIYPTILKAADVEYTEAQTLDGVDMLPFLKGQDHKRPHEDLYWRYSDGAGRAVRKGDYKLIWSGYKQKYLLFDLAIDPYEQNNLAAEMPDKVNELAQAFDNWNEGTIPAKWQDPHAENVLKEESKRQGWIDAAAKGSNGARN